MAEVFPWTPMNSDDSWTFYYEKYRVEWKMIASITTSGAVTSIMISLLSCSVNRREVPRSWVGERRDCFRPSVARLHPGAPGLHDITVWPDQLRKMVRFCLYHQFGLGTEDYPLHGCDLQGATDCIMRAFPQDSDIGTNWSMLDEGCKWRYLFDFFLAGAIIGLSGLCG